MGVISITDNVLKEWDQLLKNVDAMKANPIVKVGVLEGAGLHHEVNAAGVSTGVRENKTVAQVATWMEFGTQPSANHPGIPKRPAIRLTIENNKQKIFNILQKAIAKIIDGKSNPETELKLLGVWAAGETKRTIASGVKPENAPSTIAAKGSSKTLIDTGQYRQSITSEYVASDTDGEGEVRSG